MELVDAERQRKPELEVELELELEIDVKDDLDDPWFGEAPNEGEVYEIDPVHPLRRLSAWVRDRLAA